MIINGNIDNRVLLGLGGLITWPFPIVEYDKWLLSCHSFYSPYDNNIN